MTMVEVKDQPAPIATDRCPAWDIVIEHTMKRRDDNAYGSTGVIDRVIADMRDRDAVGRQRYGVPLTSGNGRDHLIDAYQELLDACAYLANELDEYGVGPDTFIDESVNADAAVRWRIFCVQQMFGSQVRASIQLRALIEERA